MSTVTFYNELVMSLTTVHTKLRQVRGNHSVITLGYLAIFRSNCCCEWRKLSSRSSADNFSGHSRVLYWSILHIPD
jgi:hypothetical protein